MTIELGNRELRTRLTRVAEAMLDTSPLGHSIANSFLTVTEDNFDSEGRPAWAGLSLVTIARRKSGKILFVSGQLRRSITTRVSDNEVEIGTNDPKAPTQHFGAKQGQYGKSSRNGPLPWGNIPARPFLPMDENGNLQHEAELAIFDDVDHYWHQLFNF
ncbi:phage virion morphogenesis protein [Acinetobacter baumannii]|uniref:phage virion morphogenesis protein n=1 Tax=Acinetobacter baumannii TaxID=470 RepID=UPI000D65D955|nr:phage virion morphogenesis protein [Acinetobacter baumannii]MDH2525261.1 phage virion morphogenesis protein [Acinetobacter baumannii]